MCISSAKCLRRYSHNDVMLVTSDARSLRRRNSIKRDTTMQSSNPQSQSYQSINVPMAVTHPPPTIAGEYDNKNRGIFHSSTAQTVFGIASITLLILSFLDPGSTSSSHNIKHLSDTVLNLTQRFHLIDEKNNQKLKVLEHQLDETEIELSWEKQHVDSHELGRKLMHDAMLTQLQKEEEVIKDQANMLSEADRRTRQAEAQLVEEQQENASLKRDLDRALEELARARSSLPSAPAPPGSDRKNILAKSDTKGLRGAHPSEYQPGDTIETIELEEGGKVAFRPGVVHDVTPDDTYTLVQIDKSITTGGFKREQFQSYRIYPEGMSALYKENKKVYAPITIVEFVENSAMHGLEIHGEYKFTYDKDERKEIYQGKAMRMHRIARVGEIVDANLHE